MSTQGNSRLLRVSVILLVLFAVTACSSNQPPAAQPAPPAHMRPMATGDVLTRAQIDQINATSMVDLLDGRFPGVQVLPLAGRATIVVRGLRDPLIVVDNVPLADPQELWSLNPHDVDRIEVLKEGDALYGSRGAHGVILITTRMG